MQDQVFRLNLFYPGKCYMLRIIAAAVAFGLLALPAIAQDAATGRKDPVATASVVKGPVQVNQGEEYLPLKLNQPLMEGDRVMALRNGTATIHFEDGCDLKVEPETMVEVPERSTCAGAIVLAQAITPAGTGAVGAVASGGLMAAAPQIITVVVGAIIMNEDDDETVSP